MQWLEETGADGVGLYRTEIPFMVRSEFPDLAQQTRIYREVLERADGKPVYFRTLDIGGDKQLPYMDENDDPNPALGWRSIRVGLDRPAMLRQQLRAMLHAAAGRDLYVMFPMIAEVAEFKKALRVLEMERARMDRYNAEPPAKLFVGAMLEVPGLVWQLDALLPLTDFLSIGSNDLFQFMFATDRGVHGFQTVTTFSRPGCSPLSGMSWDDAIPQACQCLSAVKWRAARSKRWRFSASEFGLCRCHRRSLGQ